MAEANSINESRESRSGWFPGIGDGIAIRLFVTCWIVFCLHSATNTVREIYPALSLGDSLSFDVSEYKGLHPDIFELEGRGVFINNNIGASILGAIPYSVFSPVINRVSKRVQENRALHSGQEKRVYNTRYQLSREFFEKARERGIDVKLGLSTAIIQVFCMAPISAMAAVVLYWILLGMTGKPKQALILALLYAFATPVFFRTGQLNQNILLAHFALFSFALIRTPFGEPGSARRSLSFFAAGLFCGWSVVLDYSGLVAVVCLTGFLLAEWHADEKRVGRDLAMFFAGGAICALALGAYQWSSFGNPFLPAQTYMPNANFTELGYRGFSTPSPDLFARTAFDLKYGLFVSSPILLAALLVPLWLRRESRLFSSRETIFAVALILLFFVFCSANQYGRMQFNTGVRHIVPVLPFLFILAANALLRLPKSVFWLVAVLGTYWSWCLAMYRDVEQGLGVFEAFRNVTLGGFQLPWLTTIERMGYVEDSSPLPMLIVTAAVIFVIWAVGPDRGLSEV